MYIVYYVKDGEVFYSMFSTLDEGKDFMTYMIRLGFKIKAIHPDDVPMFLDSLVN